MAERLTAWTLYGREVLARESGWQADRQMDRQATMRTYRDADTRADRQEDWRDMRAEQQTERQAERLPDRHALLVSGQAVGVGRRHGDSKCLWQRGRERWRETEIEEWKESDGERKREMEGGMKSEHGWLADC